MRKSHQPPAHGKQQPTADKRRGEDDQSKAPFKVDQRGEDVLQESALLADVFVRQVARAVFGNEARFIHAVPEHRLAGHAGGEPRQTELLRDDAFSCQHVLLLLLMVKKTRQSCFLVRFQCVFTRGSNMSTCRKKAQRRTNSFPSVYIWGCFGATAARRLCSAPLRAGTVSTLLLT